VSKQVLVTGAAGFIGSHLVEGCLEAGFSVRAFIRYNSANRWGWLEQTSNRPHVEIFAGDIRDYDSVLRAMQGCEEVFHLAALIGIPYSYLSPLAYVRSNIEGTYNILEAARTLGTANILVTSTSETYGTARYTPMDENHPAVGQSPYAASKVAADQLALSYYLSYGLPVRIVRPFNTYGPRQSARAVIPAVITQILQGERQIRMGNLLPTRDLTYVKDTVAGFLAIARAEKLAGTATNIGMNQEITIFDLVQLIARLMEVEVEVQGDAQRLRPERSEVMQLRCDNTRICRETDWRPRYDLESGLRETIQWLRENPGATKPELYTV
jgi:dTDP-glucose 4,6-dehydratase